MQEQRIRFASRLVGQSASQKLRCADARQHLWLADQQTSGLELAELAAP